MSILKVIEEYKTEKEEIVKLFKETFLQELFDKYENLHFIPILSYTPYFNDGEPCERYTNFYLNDLSEGMQYIANNFYNNQVLDLIITPEELFALEAEEGEEYDQDILLEYLSEEVFYSKTLNSHTINNKLTIEEIKEIEETLESVVEFIEEMLDNHTVNIVKRQGKEVVILTTEYEHD